MIYFPNTVNMSNYSGRRLNGLDRFFQGLRIQRGLEGFGYQVKLQ